MNTKNKRISFWYIVIITILISTMFYVITPINASAETMNPTVSSYEMGEDTGYCYGVTTLVNNMSFGSASAGAMSISGAISSKTSFRGTEAFGVDGGIDFDYVYNNSVLCQDDADQWEVYSNSDKTVNGVSLGSKMNKGAIVVQKSVNKQIWSTEHIATNVFDAKNADVLDYTPSDTDLRTGMYYRVIVAYEIRHKTGSFLFIPSYEYKECVEVYEFYLAYDAPFMSVMDIIDGSEVADKGKVVYGFRIDDGNAGNLISVKAPNSSAFETVKSGKAYYAPGVYTINETAKLGTKYTSTITISQGLNTSTIQNSLYQSEDNTGYETLDALKVEETVFGASSYSSISVAVPNGDSIQKKNDGTRTIIGVDGSEVFILLKTNPALLGSDWIVSDDLWGSYENETVNGVVTGQVGSGAIIVQKSADGYNWEFCADGSYSNGVFTTDYEEMFGAGGETCIYTPKGEDVIKGYTYRVYYAYEVRNIRDNQYKNIVEVYTFKLLNSDLDAVTFHNLTLRGDELDIEKESEDIYATIVKVSETLIDGSLTVTGFEIDDSLNSAVDIKVNRNGEDYSIPQDKKIIEDGKYVLTISNELGSEKTITLYVCKDSAEQVYQNLFGDAFLTGKRIFSYESIPMYEGGLSQINLKGLNAYASPVDVVILNETTGVTHKESLTSTDKTVLLENAGRYRVEVYTNTTYLGEAPSGDNHSFVFKFDLIAYGTAPGPVVNKDNLNKYNTSNNPSNIYPVYYGVSYLSASKGYITLAFANWQDAYNYVYQHEKGMVELQPDGSYRYNGNFFVSQKEKYSSGWDLTDAIDFFTNLAIKECYFDISDEFTYLTLTEETIKSVENLRTLELDKSVVIFADEKQRDILLANTGLPLINSKKYAYLTPGYEGAVDRGYHHFEFIKDAYGYDSNSVVIIDCNGKRYSIKYNESVGDQLRALGCPTGKITIEEKTVYGDTNTYEAIYIAENDNTISFDLKYYIDNQEYTKKISSANNGEEIVVNLFYLDNVIDQLGDLGVIEISDGKKTTIYSIDDPNISNDVYPGAGVYEISVVNRLGYKYTFNVKIENSNYYVINIKGENENEYFPVIYKDGEIVKLPEQTKYGYNHVGFKTEDGKVISEEAEATFLKGYTALEVVWEAKQFNVSFYVGESLYYTATVAFGDTLELPTINNIDGVSFAGWGDELLQGTLTLNEEGDIKLIACFKNSEGVDVDISDISDNDDHSKKRAWWVWVILSVLLLVFLVCCCALFEPDEPACLAIGLIAMALTIITILCMVWPSAFWWFIWWYY